jgi:hypothetical protein
MFKLKFINLLKSNIMNLQDLPDFGTISEIAWCTKFFIIWVHEMILCFNRWYLIHEEDIHQITIISLLGEDVSKGFQGPSKHVKKKREPSMYERFHTQRGGRTTKIDPILPETVRKNWYVISRKVMRFYCKGECMLDALLVAYLCANGAVLN